MLYGGDYVTSDVKIAHGPKVKGCVCEKKNLAEVASSVYIDKKYMYMLLKYSIFFLTITLLQKCKKLYLRIMITI
jgi:hypothetical protein